MNNLEPEHLPIDQSEKNSVHISSITTLGEYRNPVVQRLVKELKFHHAALVAQELGSLLADVLKQSLPAMIESGALLMPIPLHSRRKRERGFNQAALLAHAIEKALPEHTLVVNEDMLIRTKHTVSQTTLEDEQRQKNVSGVFAVSKKSLPSLSGATIILVDDVITTGATIQEAAGVLAALQPRIIHTVAIARGR
ncbi:MAG: ComF family protein [Candidatus Kerfeldbacteria bacterium]|nr:ComF family protein [Candidatus Kerfeldbacteria bacterium]